MELWPFAERSRGIAYFQLWGRLATFFTTFINPIGLDNIQWRWLIFYCCWLGFECVFVYFMFPETYGRTLEELAFSKSFHADIGSNANMPQSSKTRRRLTGPLLPWRRLGLELKTRSVSSMSLRTSTGASNVAFGPHSSRLSYQITLMLSFDTNDWRW